jgi:hypothetical protein
LLLALVACGLKFAVNYFQELVLELVVAQLLFDTLKLLRQTVLKPLPELLLDLLGQFLLPLVAGFVEPIINDTLKLSLAVSRFLLSG